MKNTSINLPKIDTYDISDQINLSIMERSSIPIFAFKIMIKFGSVDDPAGKEGLTNIISRLLKKGTKKYTAEEFSDLLDGCGATMNVFSDLDFLCIQGEFLSKDIDLAIELLSGLMLTPAFAAKELKMIKQQVLGEIRSAFDNPAFLCGAWHNKSILKGTRYARPVVGYVKSIESVSRKNVIDLYKKMLDSSKIQMVFVGDLNKKYLRDKIEKSFAGISYCDNGNQPSGSIDLPIKGKSIFAIDKPGQTQTHLRIGFPGVTRNFTDRKKLMLANTYFGGSFTSRLMDEIRVKRGLTYGIRSSMNSFLQSGFISVVTFTKNESVGEAVKIIMNELDRMGSKKIPEKLLQNTKNYLIGLYPLGLETNKKIVNKISDVNFYGLPKNNIINYTNEISSYRSKDLLDICSQYFSSENVLITALGDGSMIEKELKNVGNVEKLDYNLVFEPDN